MTMQELVQDVVIHVATILQFCMEISFLPRRYAEFLHNPFSSDAYWSYNTLLCRYVKCSLKVVNGRSQAPGASGEVVWYTYLRGKPEAGQPAHAQALTRGVQSVAALVGSRV